MRTATSKRARERAQYNRRAAAYLVAHPFCQATIARLRLDEADVIRRNGEAPPGIGWGGQVVPLATECHHRNRRTGPRLLREEFWLSVSTAEHQWIESHLGEARAIGLLCPINASPEGWMPDGSRCLTTPELLAVRAAGGDGTHYISPINPVRP